MGWRDFVPDVIEDGVEKGAEKVGDAVEWAGDKTAVLAEDVGLDGAGDWIRDKSRSAANRLGADVAELELVRPRTRTSWSTAVCRRSVRRFPT